MREMPDRKVVKFTRDGIQEKNLATGETSMLTVSSHAKEIRYSSKPPESVYHGRYSHHQQPLLPTGSAPVKGHPYSTGKKLRNPARVIRSTIASVNDSIYDSFEQSDDVGLQTLGSIRNSVVRTDRAVRYVRQNKGLPQPRRLVRSSVRSVGDKISRSLSESDDVGLQAVGSTMNRMVRADRWVSRIRGSKSRALTKRKAVGSAAKQTKVTLQAAARLPGATQKVKAASAAAHQVGRFMGTLVKLAANPATGTALIVVAGVVIAILLIVNMTSMLTGSVAGSTANTELAQYVMQLDENFQAKIAAKQQEYEQKGYTVTIDGEDSVSTNPNALAILVTGDWTDIELNDANKKKLTDVHAKLYSYSVSVKEETATSSSDSSSVPDMESSATESATSSSIPHKGRVTITIHATEPNQAVANLGFTGEKAAHVTEMLKVLDEIEISTNSEGTIVNVGTGEYIWAVPGHTRISSPYGSRSDPINGTTAFHTGLDIPAPIGTPVVASADGTVIRAGVNGGFGNCVIIQHKDGVQTLYGHNSALLVSVGQTVKQGQIIAKVGQSGRATGPHCHFEFRINGKHVDPKPYLKGAMPGS